MAATTPPGDVLAVVRERVDEVLREVLAERRAAMTATEPDAAVLVDEIARLVAAGGKRLRPAFCVLGFRAGGGDAAARGIWRAAASLELFHTFALAHDDVIDGATERRGAPTTGTAFGGGARGRAVAILVGDLAAELASHLLRTSGFPADRLGVAMERYDAMVLALAAGQFLDLDVANRASIDVSLRVARLKSGAYSVEGPLAIGASLAGATTDVEAALAGYGRALGEAFQLRDDLLDGEAAPGVTAVDVDTRIELACGALATIATDVAADLRAVASSLRMGA